MYIFAENVTSETVIRVTVAGDANGDGEVNVADAVRLAAIALGKTEADAGTVLTGDLNGDGKISTADAIKARAAALGKTEIDW